jgi:hypothetical protein
LDSRVCSSLSGAATGLKSDVKAMALIIKHLHRRLYFGNQHLYIVEDGISVELFRVEAEGGLYE